MIGPYYHLAFVTSDLEGSMEELAGIAGVGWREVWVRPRWRCVYSAGEPPFVELIEGDHGTPWHGIASGFHHVGCFTYDLEAEVDRILANGGRLDFDGRDLGGRWAYLFAPETAVRVEVIEADDETRLNQFGVAPGWPAAAAAAR